MHYSTSRLATATAIAITLAYAAGSAALGAELKAEIDPLAKPLIENKIAVGFIVGIYRDGETEILPYGEMVKGGGTEPDAGTIYEIGSVSKVFTGVILADMILTRQVKADDPVQKYLPATAKMPVKDDKPITLEHLSRQISGLPRLPDNFSPQDATNPYADYTVDQMYAFLNGHELRRAPGEYEYSNLGVGLLGHVLALKEGVAYERMLLDHVSKPLVMNDTRIRLNEEQLTRLAPPYNANLEPDKNWDIPTLAGAGAIRSTLRDMLRFAAANLKDDQQPLTLAMKLAQEKHPTAGGPEMGLGWHIARDGFTRWHGGMTGGYHTWLAVVPDKKVAVVVLANTATMRITQFGEQVTRIAFGEKVEPTKERKAIDVDVATLSTYAGSYAIVPQFVLTVTVENGQLMVQATGQPKIPVFAESKTEFFYKVVDAQITFVVDENGKVDKLILHQNGRDMPAARQK